MILTTDIIKDIERKMGRYRNFDTPGLWSADGQQFYTELRPGLDVALPPAYARGSETKELHYMQSLDSGFSPPTLRKGQKYVMDLAEPILKRFEKNKNNTYFQICLDCGTGKTILTRLLIERLKLRTVVVLKSKILGEQWKECLAGLDCYHSNQGQKVLLEKDEGVHDVLICCSPHFKEKEFVKNIRENYSLIIIDESHEHKLMNMNMISRFLALNPMSVCISLTATPNDFNDIYLGTRLSFHEDLDHKLKLYVVKPDWELRVNTTSICNYIKSNKIGRKLFQGKPISNSVGSEISKEERGFYKNLVANDDSTDLLIERSLLQNLAKMETTDAGREEFPKIIVFSSSRVQTTRLYKRLKNRLTVGVSLFDDDSLEKCREKTDPSDTYVLLTTVQKGSSGLNVPCANTIHIISPETNSTKLVQMTGRALRPNDSVVRVTYIYDASGLMCCDLDSPSLRKILGNAEKWRSGAFQRLKNHYSKNWEENSVLIARQSH